MGEAQRTWQQRAMDAIFGVGTAPDLQLPLPFQPPLFDQGKGRAFLDEPARVFRLCRDQLYAELQLRQFGPVAALGPPRVFWRFLLGIAHVAEHDGLFELRPGRPSKASRRWIIAVREGGRGATRVPTGMLDPVFRSCPARESLFGRDIVDLVACTPDMQAVTSRLHGHAAVLGHPQDAWLSESPVRVHATPLEWLQADGAGVLPVGSEEETQHYLLGCERGVVGRDLAHAEALLRKMQRQHGLPPVLVAQHSEDDDDG